MNNKKKGIWFIVGPLLSLVIIFLLNSIVQFFIVKNGSDITVSHIIGNIFMFIGIINVVAFIPLLITGIILLNKSDEDIISDFKYVGNKVSENLFMFHFGVCGRIGRLQYFLIIFVPYLILMLLTIFAISLGFEDKIEIIGGIVVLILILLNITATTKRFHDLDKSGWNFLWFIVPLVNWYFYFILLFVKGTNGDNRFGLDPLQKEIPIEVNTSDL